MILGVTHKFAALDGLRGIAALSVVCLHVCNYFRLDYVPIYAHLSVDFFFLLSGFVISHAYDRRLSEGGGFLTFLKIRAIRLYPLILLGVCLGTSIFLANVAIFGDVTLSSVAWAFGSALMLLPTPAMLYLRPWAFPLNSPLWSLTFEVAINLVYAAGFSLWTRPRLIAIAIVGAIAIVITAAFYDGLDVGYRWDEVPLGFVRILFPFTCGIILRRSITQHMEFGSWGLLTIPILLVVLFFPYRLGWAAEVFIVLLVFPAIVLFATRIPESPRMDQGFRILGNLSYPLYVTHFPFIVALSNVAKKLQLHDVQLIMMAIASFVFVLIFAWASWIYYDRPVRTMILARFAAA